MFARSAIALLNHLLAQSGWALPRLAQFNGRTARLDMPPLSFACTVEETGALRQAAADASADATLTVAPALLPRLALRDEAAFAQIQSAGDASFIEEILFLARNLRWDAAEDISRLTGDVAAERIVRFADARVQQARDTAQNLSQALAEYWTEERPLLAKPSQIDEFARGIARLREAAAKLEQRIDKLKD